MAPGDGEHLSDQERRALATLERTLRAGGARRLVLVWASIRFRLLDVWRTRALVTTGIVLAAAGTGLMMDQLGGTLWLAIAGELALSAGGLIVGRAAELWWAGRSRSRSAASG